MAEFTKMPKFSANAHKFCHLLIVFREIEPLLQVEQIKMVEFCTKTWSKSAVLHMAKKITFVISFLELVHP